jgi:hypothetical protein
LSTVGLVLDPDYGSALGWLSERMHVWAVDSPSNRAAAEAIWPAHPRDDPDTSLTLFDASAGGSTPELLTRVLGEIELHHGVDSTGLPVEDIAVIGCPLSDAVRIRFSDFGFKDLSCGSSGFRARRMTPA